MILAGNSSGPAREPIPESPAVSAGAHAEPPPIPIGSRRSARTWAGIRRTRNSSSIWRSSSFKGIGSEFGASLQRVGIHRIGDLQGWEPEAPHARMQAIAKRRGCRAPRLDMVRVWVLSSRDRGIVMRVEGEEMKR